MNQKLELHLKDIFSERSLQSMTQDPSAIEAAIKKCKNLELLEGGRVRVKLTVERKTILIKGIAAADEKEFLEFLHKLADKDVATKEFESSYVPATECVSLTFKDKESAVKFFTELMSAKFQDKPIDCLIKDGNPYIELTESRESFNQGFYYNTPRYYPQPMMGYQQPYPMMMMGSYPNPGFGDYGWGGYRGNQNYRQDFYQKPKKYTYYTPKNDNQEQGDEEREKSMKKEKRDIIEVEEEDIEAEEEDIEVAEEREDLMVVMVVVVADVHNRAR
eukprot:CAMPEP_0176439218 /NCGR_PEP_ID=MMETSP0127-20121128/19803_1 /TAXON_ID=938130 /ORGANISM="Platyophrya macrostoma, Strain WH" /LENGTH=274 /DNA_ID=CAMNT_0017823427 /DNA_START=1 /DNA_END=826 /DNA_ORIENTATION=-